MDAGGRIDRAQHALPAADMAGLESVGFEILRVQPLATVPIAVLPVLALECRNSGSAAQPKHSRWKRDKSVQVVAAPTSQEEDHRHSGKL